MGDFIALALSRRPELQVAERQIDIAERQIKLDRAAVLPHVYAYAADEDARDQNQVSFKNNINDYAFGPARDLGHFRWFLHQRPDCQRQGLVGLQLYLTR